MATPTTVNTWPLNGSVQEFDVTFDYLSQTFIKVILVGPTGLTPLILGTDYTFVTPTRIRTTLIYGPPTYTTIELRRETSTTARLVEFKDASILHATDLNTDSLQVMHVAEEARNSATETIGTNNDGNLDARGRRIVNVLDPVEPLDVVNRRWYEADVNGVYPNRVATEQARDKAREWATGPNQVEPGLESSKTYAERAKASEIAARASSTASANSAASSSASAMAASASAGSALNQAGVAEGHANAASVSASSASSSASAASSSAAASLAQANRAKDEADRAETNATRVDTDFLRNRANHTGTQPVSTISGLGTAALADSQVSLSDPSVGRLMAVGAFGIGGVEINWPSTTFNYTPAPTGFYRASNSVAAAPETGEFWGVLIERSPDGEYVKQTIWGLNNKRSYVRIITGGIAGAWRQIMTSLECNFVITGPAVTNIAPNTRYVLDNPFGTSQVICVAEISVAGVWCETGWAYSNGGYGVKASQLDSTIVIQTGSVALAASSADSGNPAGILSPIASAPCRVKVWKVNS